MKFYCFILPLTILSVFFQNKDNDKEKLQFYLSNYLNLMDSEKTYSFYSNYKISYSNSEFYEMTGQTSKSNNNVYQKIDNIENVTNGVCFLRIDNDLKTIHYFKDNKNISLIQNVDLKSILSYFNKIKNIETENAQVFELSDVKNFQCPYKEIILKFNKQNQFLFCVEAFYNIPLNSNKVNSVQPKLQIENINFSLAKNTSIKHISFEDVFIISKNDMSLNPKYKEYTVIN